MEVFVFSIIALFLICIAKNVESFNKTTDCVDQFYDVDKKVEINITKYCDAAICIPKCCRTENRIYFESPLHTSNMKRCFEIKDIVLYTKKPINKDSLKLDIYKNNIREEQQKINLKKDPLYINNNKYFLSNCSSMIETSVYLLENSSMVIEKPNYYNRFPNSFNIQDYCMEHFVKMTNDGKVHGPTMVFKVYTSSDGNANGSRESNNNSKYYAVVLQLVSCFFLLLVLFVYGAIRELRNLAGMIFMAYVATLTLTFIIRAVLSLVPSYTTENCKRTSIALYYLILSSFFWMHIMSFDIWWNMRGLYKSRMINRSGELVKFAWYGLYSWGMPLLVTIAVVIIDETDLTSTPKILKPHFDECFRFAHDQPELIYYLRMPCLALILVNCFFFLLTTFNVWRIKHTMAQIPDSTKYNNNQNRFVLYLKLSLVMGVSWVLDMVKLPDWLNWLGYIADSYNALVGLAIFIIFVCKRNILVMLCKRFSIKGPLVERIQRQHSKASTTGTKGSTIKSEASEPAA